MPFDNWRVAKKIQCGWYVVTQAIRKAMHYLNSDIGGPLSECYWSCLHLAG